MLIKKLSCVRIVPENFVYQMLANYYERRCGMIFPDNCKNCITGYTIKCESGKEYICCDSIQKCQQEKKKEGAE